MKKIAFLLFFGLASYLQIWAQNDYKTYNYYKQRTYFVENTDSAIYYFEKAFRCVDKPFAVDMWLLASKYAAKGERRKMYKLVEKLRDCGYTSDEMTDIRGNDSMFAVYRTEKRWQKIFNRPTKITDIGFVSEFSEYLGAEQYVRTYFRNDSCFAASSNFIDSLNNVRLKAYIQANGFPSEEKVGLYTYITNVMLIHIVSTRSTENEWNTYYKPLMLAEAEKGNVEYYFIATLDDRHNWLFNNTQSYGTMLASGFPDDEMPKVIDPENLDKRRAELGMPPFYIEAKYRNLKLPEGYKPIKYILK